MQTLVRSMPDLHKTLILAHIREVGEGEFQVDEMAIATEHAPFRHKNTNKQVGSQVKKRPRTQEEDEDKVREKEEQGDSSENEKSE